MTYNKINQAATITNIVESINSNQSNIYNSSSIKKIKYARIYKEYLMYTMHINYLIYDVGNLTYNHYIHLIKHAITILISMRVTNKINNKHVRTMYNRLIKYNITNGPLDKYAISVTHIEGKKKEKRSYIYKKQILVEHVDIRLLKETNRIYDINNSYNSTLSNLAYIIKKHLVSDVKSAYRTNNYDIFKKHNYNRHDYASYMHKVLSISIIRILNNIYYNYKKT